MHYLTGRADMIRASGFYCVNKRLLICTPRIDTIFQGRRRRRRHTVFFPVYYFFSFFVWISLMDFINAQSIHHDIYWFSCFNFQAQCLAEMHPVCWKPFSYGWRCHEFSLDQPYIVDTFMSLFHDLTTIVHGFRVETRHVSVQNDCNVSLVFMESPIIIGIKR